MIKVDSLRVVRRAWDLLSDRWGGKLLFSLLVGVMAPFTGLICAKVLVLRPGHCEVRMRYWWWIRNHIGSVHAGALFTLAELAGNLALVVALSDDARFIVEGHAPGKYVKKARGPIMAIGTSPIPVWSNPGVYSVMVILRDSNGETLYTVTFYSRVGPKKTD